MLEEAQFVQNTRQWRRYQIDLPVRIVALNGIPTMPVLASGTEISRAGMALRAAIAFELGDMMQLQFPTSSPSRVTAVVRNRNANSFGLQFLTQLPTGADGKDRPKIFAATMPGSSPDFRKSAGVSSRPHPIYAQLQRKQLELRQLKREIEALNMAILLLADDDDELSRAVKTVRAPARRGLS